MIRIGSDYRLVMEWGSREYGDGLSRIFHLATRICKGRGIDVGCSFFQDNKNPIPGSLPVDIALPSTGTATNLSQYATGEFDFVFSSHALEHVGEPWLAVQESWRVLKSGGVYFLYLPFPGHKDWDPSICEGARGIHLWQPTPGTVSRLLLLNGFAVDYCEYEQDDFGGFVVLGTKR